MGLIYLKGKVKNEGKEAEVDFLVDSGATYTVLKKEVWQKLKLKPKREVELILADGTKIKRKVSECVIELPQGEAHTPVILGEEEDENLIGMVTLEILGLILDPLKRELRPLKVILKERRISDKY